ncbi:ribosome-binding protein 1-like isoform X2 [Narcine bancroftii]
MEDYEKYQRNFKETILPHFIKGISSILSVVELVISISSEELSGPACAEIQGKAEVAQREVLAAEEAASKVLDLVDRGCEELTSQQGRLSRKQEELQARLTSTRGQLADLAEERKRIESQLQVATVRLKEAKQTLASARAKLGEKRTGRDIGIGLIFVLPCIGIPMAVAFEKERACSEWEVEDASKELSLLSAAMKRDEDHLDRMGRQMPELETEAEKGAETVGKVKGELLQTKEIRASLAGTQGELRSCTHYLSMLHGRLKTLNDQSRHLYSLQPLLPLIIGTCEQARQPVSGNEFLLTATQAHTALQALGTALPRLKEREQAQCNEKF